MAPSARIKFGALMFKPEVFRKQMHTITLLTKVRVTLLRLFGALHRDSVLGELFPLVLPQHA